MPQTEIEKNLLRADAYLSNAWQLMKEASELVNDPEVKELILQSREANTKARNLIVNKV